MRQTGIAVVAILIAGAAILLLYTQPQKGYNMYMLPHVTNVDQLSRVFPRDAQEIRQRTHEMIEHVRGQINDLAAQDQEQMSFENTILPFDRITGAMQSLGASLEVLHIASPEKEVRDAAYNYMIELEQFAIEHIEYNVDLYHVLKTCGESLLDSDISDHRKRYIRHMLDDFAKRGLDLPQEQRQEATELSKKLVETSMKFDANINQDDSSITATYEELAGLDDTFIQSLETSDDGKYILGTDYPTYHRVMENCRVENTRYRHWKAFSNRAYPANKEVLKQMISLRDQFAKKVGYQDYAHLDIDTQEMADSPENVQTFLSEMLERSQAKWKQEFTEFTRDLPDSVTLDERGRLKPWDTAFVKNAYKKRYHDVDETELMPYFPLDHTLHQLLAIYEAFFGIQFETVPVNNLWHQDLWCVKAYYDGALMGHIIMDLFPRENKYSHAAHITVAPRYVENGQAEPGVAFLIANFPKPQGDEPALLKRDDVTVFFHEFGHVLHGLFGATELIGQSGTNVPTDFVELPSQMLEEWLYDADILKKVSSHYQTGEPLSDEKISRIQGLQKYDAGFFAQRQVALSRMSLYSFLDGADKDPEKVFDRAFSHLRDYIMPSDENHFYAAFGHLTAYGPKYYSYLWSKVYAIDVFQYIHERGLLSQDVGQRYAENVLMQGGSEKPIHLIENFLDRAPSRDAFYRYYNFSR